MTDDATPSARDADITAQTTATTDATGAAAAPTPTPTRRRRSGGALAGLALLASLLALSAAAYLYYALIYLQPNQVAAAEHAVVAQRLATLEQRFSAQQDSLQASLDTRLQVLQEEWEMRLSQAETAVSEYLAQAQQSAPPSPRDWRLAEVAYLLRIANHRVLMEQDREGSLQMLQAADQIVAEMDDFSLHSVRAHLAEEILSLRQVQQTDLQGIYLRIEALKPQINRLPLPAPALSPINSVGAAELSAWGRLWAEAKQLVRVQRLEAAPTLRRPLLAPEEQQYLALNLRLALEQAQLATLKREQAVYEQSLLNVRRWLVETTDVEDPLTRSMLQSVDELLVLEITDDLPDVSGSLNALTALMRASS